MEQDTLHEPGGETKNSVLLAAAQWAKYVSIISFISLGINGVITLSGLFMYFVSSLPFESLLAVGLSGYFTSFIFLFFLYPAYQLYQFADNLLGSHYAPDKAIEHLRRCFKSLTLLLALSLFAGQFLGTLGFLALNWLG